METPCAARACEHEAIRYYHAMQSARRFPRFGVPILLLSLAFVCATGAEAKVARTASSGPNPRVALPADYAPLPECVDATSRFCVSAFNVDPSGTGSMTKPPGDIHLDAHFFSDGTSFSFHILKDGNDQNLAPTLPVGSIIEATANTGSWKPPTSLTAKGSDIAWSRSYSAATGWTLTVRLKTIAYSAGSNCDTDDCSAPTNIRDFASFAQATAFADSPTTGAQEAAVLAQSQGAWTATNASSFSPPWFDLEKRTINIELAGPHLTAAGVQNDGLFQSFIPKALVAGLWDSSPQELISTDSLLLKKTEDKTTTTAAPKVMIVSGGLLVSLENFHYSSPKFTIAVRPSTTRITAGRPVGKTVKIAFAAATGARSYQATCTRGSVKRTATSRLPNVVVRGLTAGTWSCRGRTVGTKTTRWSSPRLVRISK